MCENKKCMYKACKIIGFYCLLCKFVVFLLPPSLRLVKLPIYCTWANQTAGIKRHSASNGVIVILWAQSNCIMTKYGISVQVLSLQG